MKKHVGHLQLTVGIYKINEVESKRLVVSSLPAEEPTKACNQDFGFL
jgi:hypothetical protein